MLTDTSPISSLIRLTEHHAAARPETLAVRGPGRDPLDYRALNSRVIQIGRELNGTGIGRRHRVAMVLPNGPDFAVAFLGVATHACAAPLNPAYRTQEFSFYLNDMKADALLVEAGSDSPAVAVAAEQGIPVVELEPEATRPAGTFALRGGTVALPPERGGPAGADEIALLLHTSGTTSRPKLVPLTHANLCVAADNTRRAFAIGELDLCLNVMPLFHAHGLTSTLLATLIGGGGIVCTPGFSDVDFFRWFAEFRPTWYTAVPAMHQALLAVTGTHAEALESSRLRFIRSASAPLPGSVLAALEYTFGAPVIEAYGMTEAGSLVTSNPLPPGVRKTGSVGIPVGGPVAILGPAGGLLGPGRSGEIAIRGGNVMAGYEDNPEANGLAFVDGWFRTGDEGRLDEDGYLHIVGRTKEMINRGGTKVAPREIDTVLADHPGIRLGVAFGLPHPTLGEDVAAAVVPQEGASVAEQEIRAFVAERLADFKVPSRVFVVADVPRTPAGKVRRLELAKLITGSASHLSPVPSDDPLLRELSGIWARVLQRDHVGPGDNFFDLGGNSLLLTRVSRCLLDELGYDVPTVALTMHPTVAALARYLAGGGTSPVPTRDTERFAGARERLLRQRDLARGKED